MSELNHEFLAELILRALKEDLGDAGDLTSLGTIPEAQTGTAHIVSKEAGVIAGIEVAAEVFSALDPSLMILAKKVDGDAVAKGDVILIISGSTRSLLSAERVALNFLRHMSGIATATANLVELVKETKTSIVCTRKTTPGLRGLEKYAVRCGGGRNHRFGLYDAVLIKDNHIAACGSVTKALQSAKHRAGHLVKIEVEVSSIEMLQEALAEGADVIMLDNMTPAQVKEAVAIVAGRALTEASGGITHETVRAYAEAGVDLISVGWITHSAPNLDLSLDYV
ncbi:MAG: carboxylating nicotinate-nucleotide diphosphorylase [Armatimonadetes bacterium]|nr:carboxylating nicotinate-nucleotide diphosphorylase [Armatimonadota bacterium]